MNDQVQLQKLLEKIEENSRRKLLYSRIQCVFSIISAACFVILLVTVLQFMPQLEILAEQAELVLTNLEAVTAELQKLDLSEMVANINSLVTTSQAGVEEALAKINEIDFDALNQAVEDLSSIVQPLADFVKRISLGGLL